MAVTRLQAAALATYDRAQEVHTDLSADQVAAVGQILKRVTGALASIDACTQLLAESGSSELASLRHERDRLRERVKAADRELSDLRAKAIQLQALEKAQVRKLNADMRRGARELTVLAHRAQAESNALLAKANAQVDAARAELVAAQARQPAADAEIAQPRSAAVVAVDTAKDEEIARLAAKLNNLREAHDDLLIEKKQLASAVEAERAKNAAAAQASSKLSADLTRLRAYEQLGTPDVLRQEQRQLHDYRRLGNLSQLESLDQEIVQYRELGLLSKLRSRLVADNASIELLGMRISNALQIRRSLERVTGPALLAVHRQAAEVASLERTISEQRRNNSPPIKMNITASSALADAEQTLSVLDPDAYRISSEEALEVIERQLCQNADPPVAVLSEMRALQDDAVAMFSAIRRRMSREGVETFFELSNERATGRDVCVYVPVGSRECPLADATSGGSGGSGRSEGDQDGGERGCEDDRSPAESGDETDNHAMNAIDSVDGDTVEGTDVGQIEGREVASSVADQPLDDLDRDALPGISSGSASSAPVPTSARSVSKRLAHPHASPSPPPTPSKKQKRANPPTVRSALPSPAPSKSKRSAEVFDLTSSPDSERVPPSSATSWRAATSDEKLKKTRAEWVDWCPGWPVAVTTVRPVKAEQVGRFAWKFDWFPDETISPNYNQRASLTKQSNGYAPPLADVVGWYETVPWLALLNRLPKPLTFNRQDKRFTQLYLDTLLFCLHSGQALWERSHLVLPVRDPVQDDSELAKEENQVEEGKNERLKEAWTTARRSQRSKSRARFVAYFTQLCGFIQSRSFVDLDLLLDPFFLWPPGDSSVVLVPLAQGHELLQVAAERMGRLHPEREFFLTSPEHHPSHSYLDRLQGEFTRDDPAEPSEDVKLATDRARTDLGLPPLWYGADGAPITGEDAV